MRGCVWFQMVTWDYWTDGNNHCAMPQIALLAVNKFQMHTHILTHINKMYYTHALKQILPGSTVKQSTCFLEKAKFQKKTISKNFCPATHSQSRCLLGMQKAE